MEWKPLNRKGAYHYQIYLPEGVAELRIDLYDPDTLIYKRQLLTKKQVDAGLLEGSMSKREAGKPGVYLALVQLRMNDGKYVSTELPLYLSDQMLVK